MKSDKHSPEKTAPCPSSAGSDLGRRHNHPAPSDCTALRKWSAVVLDLFGDGGRTVRQYLQMLRRDFVDDICRFIHVLDVDRVAFGNSFTHLPDELPGIRHQNGQSANVLELRLHIRHHIVRVTVPVGDDDQLRRAGQHVDIDITEQLPLGFSDEHVAGADDLVNAGDRFGAEGHRRDRLGTAHLIDLVDFQQIGHR